MEEEETESKQLFSDVISVQQQQKDIEYYKTVEFLKRPTFSDGDGFDRLRISVFFGIGIGIGIEIIWLFRVRIWGRWVKRIESVGFGYKGSGI